MNLSAGCSTESLSSGGEVVLAFCRIEEIADAPDLLPEGIDGPGGSCAQMSFKLCERHLDRIEVGTIGRQEQDPGAPCLDSLLGGLAGGKLSMMTMSPLARVGASSFST